MSSSWWDLYWPFCSARVLLLGSVMSFVVLWLYFSSLFWKFIPKLDRIKNFQIVTNTWERKKKTQ